MYFFVQKKNTAVSVGVELVCGQQSLCVSMFVSMCALLSTVSMMTLTWYGFIDSIVCSDKWKKTSILWWLTRD